MELQKGAVIDLDEVELNEASLSRQFNLSLLASDEELGAFLATIIDLIKDLGVRKPSTTRFDLSGSQLFAQMSEEEQDRIRTGIVKRRSDEKTQRSRTKYRLREAKMESKKVQARMLASKIHGPLGNQSYRTRDIAAMLGLKTWQIYRLYQDNQPPLSARVPLTKDPHIIHLIAEQVKEISLRQLSVNAIEQRLGRMELARPVRYQTIQTILKKELGLTYKSFNAQNIRYRDQAFDLKRLWICRLVTQFMMQDVIILSIDESNFNWRSYKSMSWQPGRQSIKTMNQRSSSLKQDLARTRRICQSVSSPKIRV